MGRLSRIPSGRSNQNVKVTYRKLADEYSGSCDSLVMPALPEFLSYCCHHCGHTQKLQSEELHSLVGNAFRMAYAAQLQKQPPPPATFRQQDVIVSRQLDQTQDKVLWTKELSSTALKSEKSQQKMDVQIANDAARLEGRLAPPNSIPGLKPGQYHKYNQLGPPDKQPSSQQSTPSSDESNSPTEMNSYKRMAEKPPLIKRIAMGLTGSNGPHDEDSCPLVSDNSTPGSPTNRPLSGGYVNETEESKNRSNHSERNDNLKHIEIDNTLLLLAKEKDSKTKRISQLSSSSSSSGPATETSFVRLVPTPPPLPERTDSLNNKEEGELRAHRESSCRYRLAPWYQAGIPREIALEILAQEPVGAFMVRESTSKPGCFALSLRVPRSFQPTGIAHYLIVRTNKGYKIKGFTKEFTTLTSLITHHSVMPELLPCPLSLSRYHPAFAKSDSRRDFADIDLDPDYNTLADFRKMMADLNV